MCFDPKKPEKIDFCNLEKLMSEKVPLIARLDWRVGWVFFHATANKVDPLSAIGSQIQHFPKSSGLSEGCLRISCVIVPKNEPFSHCRFEA